MLAPAATLPRRARWLTAAVVVVLAVSMVPPFLSERYLNEASAIWGEDLQRAYDNLDRAGDLNRLSDQPLLLEGAIAEAAGDEDRAIDAFREATAKRPEEWAGHYFLAQLYRERNPRLAREELAIVRELNPLGERVTRLEDALGRDAAPAG